MEQKQFSNMVYDQVAGVAQAFASSSRLAIIQVLAQGPRDVESLANQVGYSIANTSRHLQVLKSNRIVQSTKVGVRVVYRLSNRDIHQFWRLLESISDQQLPGLHQHINTHFQSCGASGSLTPDDLRAKMQAHQVLVLDVRPDQEYEVSHIASSISIPSVQLEKVVSQIPDERDLVICGRGPACHLIAEAMVILSENGFTLYRYLGDTQDWAEAGFPVEQGR